MSNSRLTVLAGVAGENTLPFDLKPNQRTRQTMRNAAQVFEVQQAKDTADHFNQLGS